MANPDRHPDPSDLTDGAELLDEALARANPNPGRGGCPPREALIALARRQRPVSDPTYEHLVQCSPCYRAFRAAVRAERNRSARRTAGRWWIGASAAASIIVALSTWLLISRERPEAPSGPAAVQTAALPVELDLRKYSVTRRDQPPAEQPLLTLPRGRLALTILLPTGSEPGDYDVQILDSSSRPVSSAGGTAEIRDFVTTLRVVIDLQPFNSGAYQLAIRRDGDQPRLFPVQIQ